MPPNWLCRLLNEGMLTASVEVVEAADEAAVVVHNHGVIDHWLNLKAAVVVFCKRPYQPKTKSLVWKGE